MDPAVEPGRSRMRPAGPTGTGSLFLAARRSIRRRAGTLRRIALWWLAAALVGFSVLALLRGVPRSPELSAAEVPIQAGLLALAALGGLGAVRSPAVGATVTTLAAFGVGIYAAVEFPPLVAAAALLALLTPAVLLWLVWQGEHGAAAIGWLAALMAVLLVGGYLGATTFYDAHYGATHPDSAASLRSSFTRWIWSGGITDRSAVVVAKPADPTATARLAVWSTDPASARTYTGDAAGDAVRFSVDALEPGTRYRYALEVEGIRDPIRQGSFRTATTGPMTFSVAFASCARTGSNGAVYDAIAAEEVFLFIEYGDFFYGDVGVDDTDRFRSLYDTLLEAPGPQTMLLDTPIVYVWDDHDFGTNDSDRDSPSAPAAAAVYRDYVPAHPLAEPDGHAVYRSFDVGRVRFIVTDVRAARDPKGVPDGPGKSMLGPEQKAWFFEELRSAADTAALTVWVNPVPWIVPEAPGEDSWGGYAFERAEIADEIARLGMAHRLVMLSGDAHMLAIDDGTQSGYASSGDAGFVVMQAAALDRVASLKGGPYSEGAYPGGGRYGLMEIVDDGTTVEVSLTGKDWTGAEIVGFVFTVEGGVTP